MSLVLLGILNSQAAAAGGAGAYELIDTIEVTGASTQTVSFSSIPSNFKHLEIRGVVASSKSSQDDVMMIRLNGSTSYIYTWSWMAREVTTFSGTHSASRNYARINKIVAASNGTNFFSPLLMSITDYANTSKNTTMKIRHGNNFSSGAGDNYLSSSVWQSTDAVSSIEFSLALSGYYFTAGSRLSLIGIRG
jgi:hypothetical protein